MCRSRTCDGDRRDARARPDAKEKCPQDRDDLARHHSQRRPAEEILRVRFVRRRSVEHRDIHDTVGDGRRRQHAPEQTGKDRGRPVQRGEIVVAVRTDRCRPTQRTGLGIDAGKKDLILHSG